MDYLTLEEIAERWGVSVHMLETYLENGRVTGAIQTEDGWKIPLDAQKPTEDSKQTSADRVGEQYAGTEFMPIMSISYHSGQFREAVDQIADAQVRQLAWAGQYYFQGQAIRAQEAAQNCFDSQSADVRLSARWVHAMAAIGCGDSGTCLQDFEEIKREQERAQEKRIRIECELVLMISRVYFHDEEADMGGLTSHFASLPEGVRYFAMYGRAHALYLRKEYHRTIGEVEAAMALMHRPYPIAAIYLNIVGAMASISLARHKQAQQFFDRAWEIALPEDYFEPFAEHHGLLQGLVERKIRGSQPELYQRISEMVYRFSRGWMKIHNPNSKLKVTDTLTPYEFSIAMLAAKGRTNKEIAEYMAISVNSVKAYLTTIYQKIGISNRAELKNYVNY